MIKEKWKRMTASAKFGVQVMIAGAIITTCTLTGGMSKGEYLLLSDWFLWLCVGLVHLVGGFLIFYVTKGEKSEEDE